MPDTHTRTQHTPGPWTTGEQRGTATEILALDGNYIVVMVGGTRYRTTTGDWREEPQHIANANLIAAAPLMAATLVAIIDALKLAQGYGFEEELSIAQGALEAAGVNPEGYEAMELRHQ